MSSEVAAEPFQGMPMVDDSGGDAGAEGGAIEAGAVTDDSIAALEAETEGSQLDADGMEGEDANPDAELSEGEEGAEGEEAEPDIFEVTVDGETFEVDLDELKAGYSRNRAATKRFQEAAKLRREVQGFVQQLKQGDPHMIASLFKQIGVDFDKVAEQRLSGLLEEMQLPEHERGMRELQRERQRFEQERKAMEQRSREAQIAREAEAYQQQYIAEIQSAFSSHGVEPTPTLQAAVARELEQSLSAGHPLSTADAVAMVLDDIRARVRTLPPEQLQKLLGRQAADQMRREEAQSAAQQQRAKASQVARRPAQQRRQPQRQVPEVVNPERIDDIKALFDS